MIQTLRAFAGGLLLLAVPTAAAGPRQTVALVYQVSGEAQRTAPGRSPELLHPLDRLPAGIILELKPGSRVSLAFVTGRRYELSGPARATLGPGDLAARSGAVRTLAPVPPLPLLKPIAVSDHPGQTAGAIIIRGDEIQGLYPGHGTRALASSAVLSFESVDGAQRYSIEVEDEWGEIVYGSETVSSRVTLPENVLRPGMSYHWSVRTLDRPGSMARGEADFTTLDAKTARAREELRRFVERAGDPESFSLLAGVDQGLGLLAEAWDERRPARAYASRAEQP